MPRGWGPAVDPTFHISKLPESQPVRTVPQRSGADGNPSVLGAIVNMACSPSSLTFKAKFPTNDQRSRRMFIPPHKLGTFAGTSAGVIVGSPQCRRYNLLSQAWKYDRELRVR